MLTFHWVASQYDLPNHTNYIANSAAVEAIVNPHFQHYKSACWYYFQNQPAE